jgi:hypothetical protein
MLSDISESRQRTRQDTQLLACVAAPSARQWRSKYESPHQYATGVSTVVVNGEVVVDGGDHTGALPGRVLRRQAAA